MTMIRYCSVFRFGKTFLQNIKPVFHYRKTQHTHLALMLALLLCIPSLTVANSRHNTEKQHHTAQRTAPKPPVPKHPAAKHSAAKPPAQKHPAKKQTATASRTAHHTRAHLSATPRTTTRRTAPHRPVASPQTAHRTTTPPAAPQAIRQHKTTQLTARPVAAAATSPAKAPVSQPHVAASSALVIDLQNQQVLYARKADEVRPVASLTKLMTAMVVLDARQPLDELLTVDIRHIPELKGVYSRLRLNSKISRRNMLLLALMSSENRAAASLANHYPGGYTAFIRAMNAKARSLGMKHTHYAEPTGLSVRNVSTARDLAKLAIASERYPLMGEFSTTDTDTANFTEPNYSLPFRNTNHLIFRDGWHIQLSKTGFTNAAGHCLVMRTTINHRPTVLIVLDAFGKYTHFADASRLRNWLEEEKATHLALNTAEETTDEPETK